MNIKYCCIVALRVVIFFSQYFYIVASQAAQFFSQYFQYRGIADNAE